MLQNTGRLDLKYIKENPNFKIVTWFRKFLAAIPGGLDAVKFLNFPHMHWFNSMRFPPALTNPSFELVAVCTNLHKLDITWHSSKLRKLDPDRLGLYMPSTAFELVNEFKLHPILECATLEEVYFDGIYDLRYGHPSDLNALVGLAKWIFKDFLVRRGQKVKVEVARRCGKFRTRVPGTIIALNDKEMAEVDFEVQFSSG